MKITKEEFAKRKLDRIALLGECNCPDEIGLPCIKKCATQQLTCAQCWQRAIEQGVEK